jgi:hypothetical protein
MSTTATRLAQQALRAGGGYMHVRPASAVVWQVPFVQYASASSIETQQGCCKSPHIEQRAGLPPQVRLGSLQGVAGEGAMQHGSSFPPQGWQTKSGWPHMSIEAQETKPPLSQHGSPSLPQLAFRPSEVQPAAVASARRLVAQKKRKRAAGRPARSGKDRDVASENQPGRGASLKTSTR